MSDSIKVAIKVRPFIKREIDENLPVQWVTQGNTIVATDSEIKKRGDGGFQFDHIFDTSASNNDVFDNIVRPIVDAAVNGFNGTVFAYGQTSSGKTYTMMGTSEEAGVIPLAVEHMFDAIANTAGREFLLRVSYLEIYNEKVNDLLYKDSIDLKVHEDLNGQVFVKCKEEVTNCPENVLSIMNKGNKNRRIGETNMNERSSRSHTIFRITIESRVAGADSDGAIQVSQLNMVDLAGSERVGQTGATGERFKEGRHINTSLSALALVIKQLSEPSDSQKYINFRDSKLTRLLQASLGGNAMTAIICAVTPAALDETQYTLSFATRARNIKNKPELNEVMSDGVLLKRYAKQIDKLHTELDRMKQLTRSADFEEMESKMQEKDRINQNLEERIRLLQTRIVTADNRNNMESFKVKEKRRQTWCGTAAHKRSTSFRLCANLSPIKEMSPIKSSNRKSDIMDASFQIAFADFELELMNSEAAREEENDDSDEDTFVTYRKQNRVKFKKNEIICKSPVDYDNCNAVSQKIDTSTQTVSNESPGTPKQTLRNRIRHLADEYSQLQEFTTLEKQTYIEDQSVNLKEKLSKVSLLEKQIENLTSDKDAFEHIACELRKKLTATESRCMLAEEQLNVQVAELQKIPYLEQRVTQLSACEIEMQKIAELQKQITLLAAEKDGYEHVASDLRKKLNETEQLNILLEEKLAKQNIESEKSLVQPLLADNMQQELMASQITTIASEKDELQRVVTDLQDKLAEAQSCNNTMKNKLDEQEQKLQTLQNLEERVTNYTSEKNIFEFTICEMKNKLKDAEEANDLIRDKLNEQQLEIKKFQGQKERIELLTSENQKLQHIVSELQDKLIEAEEINDSMKDKTDECQDVHEYQQEKQFANSLIQEMESEHIIDELKEKLKEIEVMNNSMKSTLDTQEQKNRDFEKQIENLAIEKSKFESTVAELEEKLKEAELMNSTFQSKLNEYETNVYEMDSLEATNKTLVSEKKFEYIISELQEELKEAELKYIEQKGYFENLALEKDKLEDTVRELQGKSEQAELHNNLLKDRVNEQELQLQKTRSLEKEIECLTSRTKEFEITVDELRKKLANTENCASTKDESDGRQLQRIQELEEQIVKLTSERDKYEQVSAELHRQSIKSPEKETGGSHDSDDEIKRLNSRLSDLQSIVQDLQRENTYLKERTSAKLTLDHEYELNNSDTKAIDDFSITRTSLEEDSAKLSADLLLKNQELDEIKHDVQGLKADIEDLQKTIYLLTTENSELASKLTTEKECTEKLTVGFQKEIDKLYARNSKIMDEKIDLESNMKILKEEVEILRLRTPEVNLNEEQTIRKYEEQISVLTANNVELLSNITNRTNELEMLKESKSLRYKHNCMYRDELTKLTEKYEYLITENNELSTDLMERIEENDELRQKYDNLEKKLKLLEDKENAMDNNDTEEQKTMNTPLKTDENTKVSHQLIETTKNVDNTRKSNSVDNTLYLSTLFNDTLTTNDMIDISLKDNSDEAKILNLQEEINRLTHLNSKLSDLKLGTCTQCIHLKEIAESRRSLKLEVKSLSRKLEESNRKFNNESAKKDALMLKAKEDINISISNSSFNASFSESMNVSFVEERLQSLSSELKDLKEDHDRLSDMYKEKCNDFEELQSSTVTDFTQSNVTSSLKKASGKTSSRIENIERVMRDLENDFAKIKQDSVNVKADLAKFINEKESLLSEINSLKTANEQLLQKLSESELAHTTALESADILENEITDMIKKLQELTVRCKEMENAKLLLEIEVESLKEDKSMKERTVNELRQSSSCLQHEMDIIRKEKEECEKHSNLMQQEYEKKLKSLEATNEELSNSRANISRELDSYKKSECQLIELNEKISKCTSENDYLKQELIKLRDIESKFEKMRNEYQSKSQQDKILADDNKKLKNILNDTSENIIKEIKSLKPNVDTQEFLNKSVNDLFFVFLETILAKEKEIVKTMRKQFDKDKQKLEDEKQQSVDAEKRTRSWAKELENEIEKLQADLSKREIISDKLQEEVTHLKQLLKENDYDRNVLKEKISLLETDFNTLQTEYDKYAKIDPVNEEAIIIAQKRQKQAQEAVKNKEAEFQMKLKSEKEAYNKRIEDLTCTIESFKTKNMELMSNIEGLDANQKQLKNIIDLKINESMKNSQVIQKMRTESKQLMEAYNDLNQELEEKKLRIMEITELLKNKCDELTEYKANLQTIMPENDLLKQQISERKASIEQYKMEIETLKMESKKELDEIKDELKFEELKGVELNKQIIELNNNNTALTEEINTLKHNYSTLQSKCTSLERRVRNSTSKVLAEEQIEELRDLNRSLRNNLDGASNRIAELQDTKNDLMREVVSLNSQYEAAYKGNQELKEILASYKSKYENIQATDDKYDLIQEKNKIALELEATKVQLNQKNKDIENYLSEIEKLTQKNVEFDQELDELAEVIREHDAENARLQDQLYSCRAESDELQKKIETFERKNLQSQSTQKTNASNNEVERSFNDECNCTTLKNKIRELQLEIVSKNGKIATLELQIRSGSFPYQNKCRELQEHLSAQRDKNSELKAEVKRLQMAVLRTSAEECNVCKQRLVNRRNQSCQTIPNNVLRFCGISSGIIDDEARITKLEKEKQIMKDLCRSRSRTIKELEKRLEEYEKLAYSVKT